jgi:gliding motility-associated-like protein
VSGQGTSEIQIDQPGTYNLFIPNPNTQCDDLNLSFEATNDVLPDTPIAAFDPTPFVCGSFPVNFTNQSTSESYLTSVSWDFGDGDTSALFSPTHVYDSLGSFEVSLIITNETACSDTVSYIINVIDGPQLDLGPDRTLCNREETEITPEIHSGGNSYLWSTGETSQSIFVDEPQQLILYLSNGCTVSDTLNITDYGLYFGDLPNVITVNNDQINDDFIIPTAPLEEYHIVITNRWGNKVFETNQTSIHWDGKFNGDYVDEGVYFYLIDYRLGCQDEMERKHGNVTVVR